jgi:hypothetical protein
MTVEWRGLPCRDCPLLLLLLEWLCQLRWVEVVLYIQLQKYSQNVCIYISLGEGCRQDGNTKMVVDKTGTEILK